MAERQSSAAQMAQLPAPGARMQVQIERLYLERLALDREVQALRATQPVIMVRPPRPGIIGRIVLRISQRAVRRRNLALLRGCGLMDGAWYLRTYADVAQNGADPAAHYLAHGATDLRNPGPYFDTGHYLHLYPDIAEKGLNPLVHYILSGIDEGRSIRPGMPHGADAL